MANKQWTIDCILAGVKVGRLIEKNKLQEATDYLTNLATELTTIDLNYLMNEALGILTGKGGENNGS